MSKSIHNEHYRRVINRIRTARIKQRYSQRRLSATLNRHQNFVSKYERHEQRLDFLELMEICNVLEISPYETFSLCDPSADKP